MMGDIAVLTAATAIYKDLGVQLEAVKMTDLGRCKKITISSENTTMVGGAGKKTDIEARVALIKREIETTTSSYDREKLEERLAKLAGGVAQINVGAATETEMKEKKYLYEDARAATKAALEEGIVPGGGVALLRSDKALDKVEATGDEVFGVQIVKKVLDAPIRCIAENAGIDGAVVVNRIRQMKGKNDGYDADKNVYGDMMEAGIIDPAKVVKTAITNAASVAGLLLTTSCTLSEIPKDEPAMPPGGGGMDPSMMGGMGGMGGMGMGGF